MWKSVGDSGNAINLAAEDTDNRVEGTLLTIERGQGNQGNSSIYTLEKEDGATTKVWGSAVIDDRVTDGMIGEMIAIEYQGKGKSKKGNTFNKFDVQIWDDKKKDGGDSEKSGDNPNEPDF